jgi:60 kDa SS-A/Ro ribonucleoprotein
MSRIGKLFGKLARRSTQAPSVNRATGCYPAWERPLEEQYVQTLLTNSMGNAFYASAAELTAEALALHDQMIAQDPMFAAKALAFARTRGFMRAQPVLGLAKLAAVPGPLVEQAFGEVVRTPHDLGDFATIVKALRGGEGGRRVKRLAGQWLATKLSEYWVLKYGAPSGSGGYALRDLVKVYHPKLGAKLPLFDYLLGKSADLSSLPQVQAFETLKTAASDDDKARAVTEGRLPHEIVTPFARSSKVWAALVPNLPAMALLRHLVALERHGVIEQARAQIDRKLRDARVIAASKILPLRYVVAGRQVTTAWVKDALRDALELAFANVPALPGRTVVMLDRSGSMQSYVEQAAIFAVSLLKAATAPGRLLAYDDRVDEVLVSKRDSVLSQAEQITARGGTDTSLPVRQLLAEKHETDNIVLITDEQQNTGTPFLDVLDEYRRKVKADVRVFILDVAPYRNAVTPQDPNTFYVYGWSDQALRFIAMAAHGFGGQVEAIRSGIN